MRPTRRMPARWKDKQPPGFQRGFLLIMAVVLIVIAALLLTVMMFLGVTGTESSASHSQSARALFIAESGVERALYGFSKEGTACASLTYTAGLGEGNFSTTGALYAPAATALSAAISATDTVIPVASTAGYAPHGRLTIGAESINYTGSSATSCGAFSAPCFTGILRGAAGSTAAAHALGAAVNQSQCLVRSLGTVGSAQRTVERAISSSGGNVLAMAVYAKQDGNPVPYFRIWDGTAWGAEGTALAVGTDVDIHFVVLKFARTRNEAILGVQYLDNTTGQTAISVQRWDGTSWTGLTTLATGIGGGDHNRRGFDIEYETANDRAVVVYRLAGNGTEDPDYRIWDGSNWTAAATIIVGTTQAPRWIELAPNPLSTSNEIAMMLVDRADDVYGMAWTGAAWDTMGVGAAWDDADDSVTKTIDVAYEQQSGRAMFIWADDVDSDQRYRLWDGSTSTLGGILTLDLGNITGPDMNGRGEWVRLAPRSGSNEILYGVQDDNDDLFTALWSGAAWGSGIRHDDAVEDGRDRNFDIVFETYAPNTHLAWLVWGNGASLSRRQWNSNTSSWGGTTTTGGDTALVQLMAHPSSGVVLSAIYEDQGATFDDLREMHLPAGGAWTVLTNPSTTPADPFWAGQTVNNPVLERVTLAPYRYGFDIYDWIEVFP